MLGGDELPRGQQRKEVIKISEGVTVETSAKESDVKRKVEIKETKKSLKVGHNQKWERQVREEKGRFGISELTNQQLKAINLLVYTNMKNQEIFRELEVPKSTFYSWFHSDKFLAELKKERDSYFKQMSTKAIKRLCELMDSPDTRVALKACEDVLRENQHLLPQVDVEQKTTEITVTLIDDGQEDD